MHASRRIFVKALIVDGYIDEPAAFGVPPYISPKIRVVAGAFFLKGVDVDYLTIDSVREGDLWSRCLDYDYLVIHGGTTTPGRYLGGTPISSTEVSRLLNLCDGPVRIVAGPIVSAGYTLRGGTTAFNPDFSEAEHLLKDERELLKILDLRLGGARYDVLNPLYSAGAEVIKQHPSYPDVMVEFDISSGCERIDGFCSFCTESLLYGNFLWRDMEGIEGELKALKEVGVKALRFGRSANVTAYGYDRVLDRLDPGAIERLFSTTRDILDPEVLHIDNGNPIFITHHEREARKALESIVRYNTCGDTISFGVESFDTRVRELNNLGGSVEEIYRAIELVNEIGGQRVDGIPKLLPGVNLLYGLPGHSSASYKIDFEELAAILDSGLVLRRINIRQVMIFPGTPLSRMEKPKVDHRLYEKHRQKIRTEIDYQMLKKVFPVGSIIKGVIPAFNEGQIFFGRPLGTYPILVGSPVSFKEKTDIVVIDHGMRSITGLPLGTDINSLGERELRYIPGIGRDRARTIVFKRPSGTGELAEIVGNDTIKTMSKLGLKLGGKEI
jgi:radical SAM superfamily enzyme with C-terminal helix-hairpin-helix motif